ncbi:MAG: hypothetical protein WC661_19135 [Opitutaceae bacterium]|jgi:hypothetical protein
MRIPLRLCTLIGVVFSIATLDLAADMTPYVGRWQVDIPATCEAVKNSPKYNPAEADQMKGMITRMLGSMILTVDDAKVTFARGKRSESQPYTFKDTTDGVTTISVTIGQKPHQLAFTLGENHRMRLKSSASPDMDYYVWQPATTPPGEAPNAAEMLAAGMGGKVVAGKDAAKPAPTINDNLRIIMKAADQYGLEMGVQAVPYEALVKGRYFKPLQVVNGEDYATVVIDYTTHSVSVTDKDGVTHTCKKP